MKRSIATILVLFGLLTVATIAAPTIAAQEPTSFYWEFINVDIDVQENGEMLITETQKYVFTSSSTVALSRRWIPTDKVDSIVDMQVLEEGRIRSDNVIVGANKISVIWAYPVRQPESRIFVLKYRVIGGLHIYDGGDQVYWKALFGERVAPIESGKVTVHLPSSLAGEILDVKSFGAPADARQVDDRTVEFVPRASLPPGEELEIKVTFTHGILGIAPSSWQKAGQEKQSVNWGAACGAIIAGAIFGGVLFLIHRAKQRFSGGGYDSGGFGGGGGD